jgi:hypothetical protein
VLSVNKTNNLFLDILHDPLKMQVCVLLNVFHVLAQGGAL